MIEKMRNSTVIALAMAAAVLLPLSAGATSSLSLVWDDSGAYSPTITRSQAGVERASIIAVGDTAGLGGIFISFMFNDELDIATAGTAANGSDPDEIPGCKACTDGGKEQTINLPGGGNSFQPGLPGYTRNQIESTPGGGLDGLLGSYDVTSGGTGLISATRTLGSVFFLVKGNEAPPEDNGADVVPFVLNDNFDAVLDGPGNDISSSVIFNGARVIGAPEPGTAALALGTLASLGFLAIRRRR